jgi:periplasmic protein TonB
VIRLNIRLLRARLLWALFGMAFCLLLAVALYFLFGTVRQAVPSVKRNVQQVSLLAPSPPPLPPLRPEIKPPPQQRMLAPAMSEQIPQQQSQTKSLQPKQIGQQGSPQAALALDADGVPGGDVFALSAQSGSGSLSGNGAGNGLLWYGGQVQRRLEEGLESLLADTAASKTEYSVQIRVWVDAVGRISRSELASSSGKEDVDRSLRAALAKFSAEIGQQPPLNLPQPLTIELIARL